MYKLALAARRARRQEAKVQRLDAHAAKMRVRNGPPVQPPLLYLVYASNDCAICHGTGNLTDRSCRCAARNMFRAALSRAKELRLDQTLAARNSALPRYRLRTKDYDRPGEEFLADFESVVADALRSNAFELRVWNLYFKRDFSWQRCARELRCDRGTVFHSIYRLQAVAGRALREAGLVPGC
jgi:hypothetical protein